MKKTKLLTIILSGVIFTGCVSNELSQSSLKDSISKSAQDLNTAINAISSTEGYKVLAISTGTSSSSAVKSLTTALDSTYNSILLTDISGVYDYKATKKGKGQDQLFRFFTKTSESSDMIVRLPEEKVKKPNTLLHYSPADTLLTNNYIIDLSKYEYHFNRFLGWDYQMASTINIKTINVGALSIQSSSSATNGYKYASQFVFADGYKASCDYASGDTAVATYAISNGTNTLYAEKYTAIKTSKDKKHKEKQYSLTIGNVEIVRGLGHNNSLDSAKVYVGGVLQTSAKVEIVDSTTVDATNSSVINHNRDLKITFDDGTSSTISELLGTSVSTIRSLFASLRQSTFAVDIIDWIAWDIYTNKD